ncbi:Hypothetical predicted protein [Cloeon dipterum]|uniref:Uncharacterized protein n=1 Tax=Cloeon dipterum TaxID=197152 RepID=A0A8S1CMW5_9INSE|nr:Hypothetical predicted protein [Cloeon dipterum]
MESSQVIVIALLLMGTLSGSLANNGMGETEDEKWFKPNFRYVMRCHTYHWRWCSPHFYHPCCAYWKLVKEYSQRKTD